MTYRRLDRMATARQRANWAPISPILVAIHNYLRDTNKEPEPITDLQHFNPFIRQEDRPKKQEQVINVEWTDMRWIMGG